MGKSPASINLSSIKDNHKRGSVGEFLIESITPQSNLSVVSAYFTIYRQLKNQLEELCGMFNAETNQGNNMSQYTDLLRKAIDEIIRMFNKRSTQKLTTDRGALLIPKSKQINDMNNFEMVTWLVIK